MSAYIRSISCLYAWLKISMMRIVSWYSKLSEEASSVLMEGEGKIKKTRRKNGAMLTFIIVVSF